MAFISWPKEIFLNRVGLMKVSTGLYVEDDGTLSDLYISKKIVITF